MDRTRSTKLVSLASDGCPICHFEYDRNRDLASDPGIVDLPFSVELLQSKSPKWKVRNQHIAKTELPRQEALPPTAPLNPFFPPSAFLVEPPGFRWPHFGCTQVTASVSQHLLGKA